VLALIGKLAHPVTGWREDRSPSERVSTLRTSCPEALPGADLVDPHASRRAASCISALPDGVMRARTGTFAGAYEGAS